MASGDGVRTLSITVFGKVLCFTDPGSTKGLDNASFLGSTLPYLIAQLFVSNVAYRAIYHSIRPLYLPPLIAQILCGVVVSPSLVGSFPFLLNKVFPMTSMVVLESFANIALVYSTFLMGLEMDLNLIKVTDTKSLTIASATFIITFSTVTAIYHVPGYGHNTRSLRACFYFATVLTSTNFRELSRILADLKLLRSDVGRSAMPVAIITDFFTWIVLALLVSSAEKGEGINGMMPYYVLSTAAFVLFSLFVVRPVMKWVFSKAIKQGHIGDNHVWSILVGVVVCGFITDACGTHSIVGSFVFGLVIPRNYTVRSMIEEKLYDFLGGILMPLFFVVSGMRSDVKSAFSGLSFTRFVSTISLVIGGKAFTSAITGYFYGMSPKDGLALGFILNAKGLMVMIILNAGRDLKILDVYLFSSSLLIVLTISALVEPVLIVTYKPKKRLRSYRYHTIQTLYEQAEFRVLVCIHDINNASGMINALRISNPTKQSPLNVFAIHLVELTGRTTASMLIMNDENKPKINNFSDHIRAESDQISEMMESVEVINEGVTVQTVTAVSPYATIHEDICGLAEDKRVNIILLPYHMRMSADRRLEDGNDAHAEINRNVMQHSPCSVGILVDRGTGTMSEQGNKHVVMLFIGGPDDREALFYAWRMAGDRGIDLTVVRFIPSPGALQQTTDQDSPYLDEKEKEKDEESLYEFSFKTKGDSSMIYIEKVVNDGQETIAVIRDLDENSTCDFYVVGRGYGLNSPVTLGLSDWSFSPELGIMGDTLASSNFMVHSSVLVIQQYSDSCIRPTAVANELGNAPKKSPRDVDQNMVPNQRDKGRGRAEDDHDSDD